MSGGPVIALVSDLLDRSRIQGVARAVGTKIEFASSPDEVDQLLSPATPAVFINLNDNVDPIEAITRLVAGRKDGGEEGNPTTRLIGFVSHVDEKKSTAAKNAGCDEVLSRALFFRRLSVVLAEAASSD